MLDKAIGCQGHQWLLWGIDRIVLAHPVQLLFIAQTLPDIVICGVGKPTSK